MAGLAQETVDKLMGNVPKQRELESIRVLASEPGSVRYEIDVPDNVLNYHGCIHGGFVSTMLEIAAGMATYAYGESNVAITCATNFIRAVGPQRLTVSADTTHKGRSTSVAHCTIVDERGKLVAESTFTMFFLGPLEG